MPIKIVLDKISFGYTLPLFKKVNLTVAKEECIEIFGKSGVGKSSFLEICAGILHPHSGSVYWDDQEIKLLSKGELFDLRIQVGYVFQNAGLISAFSVFDNIALPLRYHSSFTEREISTKVYQILDEFGLSSIAKSFPERLSSFQAKAVALARAIVPDPEILFLDDLAIGIDGISLKGILNVLSAWRSKVHATIIGTSSIPYTYAILNPTYFVLNNCTLEKLSQNYNPTDENIF